MKAGEDSGETKAATAQSAEAAVAIGEDIVLPDAAEPSDKDLPSSSHHQEACSPDVHLRAPLGDESKELVDGGCIAAAAAEGKPPWKGVKMAIMFLKTAENKAERERLEAQKTDGSHSAEDSEKRLGRFSFSHLSENLLEDFPEDVAPENMYWEERLKPQSQERFMKELNNRSPEEITQLCLERARFAMKSKKDDVLLWLGYVHPHLKEQVGPC